MNLSADKKAILLQLSSWLQKQPSQYISIGGYAGTGKTTLIAVLRTIINKKNPKLKIAFASYTGKATQVLQNFLKKSNSLYSKDFIGTIHSLIYTPIVSKEGIIIGWEKKQKLEFNLIVIDEASMVSQEIWEDLISFNLPIIVFGDHGQLPPIGNNFSLMKNPDLKLETIHRQLADNPIIQISILAREKGLIPNKRFSGTVEKFSSKDPETQERVGELLASYTPETLILCGYNWTRVKLNQEIRQILGFEDPAPQPGDRVICLRNNHQQLIYNGMIGTIQNIRREDDDWYQAEIKMDDREDLFSGKIAVTQFNSSEALNFTKHRKRTVQGDLFDFGYALTVHKAQGSQAKKVILFEQRFSKMNDDEWRRWLYTAVTRAEEELYIISSS